MFLTQDNQSLKASLLFLPSVNRDEMPFGSFFCPKVRTADSLCQYSPHPLEDASYCQQSWRLQPEEDLFPLKLSFNQSEVKTFPLHAELDHGI